eukprot:TRINITY_DN7407_c0_g1_i1.p1 TRINITY_DN7407_c0_g1~~TRINITY_DN7407_c0_g1_i1.p1  ORF type:complete len:725 (+),score=154.74 TRINITY_DN7407_c0_g1_i1:152-2176(+)
MSQFARQLHTAPPAVGSQSGALSPAVDTQSNGLSPLVEAANLSLTSTGSRRSARKSLSPRFDSAQEARSETGEDLAAALGMRPLDEATSDDDREHDQAEPKTMGHSNNVMHRLGATALTPAVNQLPTPTSSKHSPSMPELNVRQIRPSAHRPAVPNPTVVVSGSADDTIRPVNGFGNADNPQPAPATSNGRVAAKRDPTLLGLADASPAGSTESIPSDVTWSALHHDYRKEATELLVSPRETNPAVIKHDNATQRHLQQHQQQASLGSHPGTLAANPVSVQPTLRNRVAGPSLDTVVLHPNHTPMPSTAPSNTSTAANSPLAKRTPTSANHQSQSAVSLDQSESQLLLRPSRRTSKPNLVTRRSSGISSALPSALATHEASTMALLREHASQESSPQLPISSRASAGVPDSAYSVSSPDDWISPRNATAPTRLGPAAAGSQTVPLRRYRKRSDAPAAMGRVGLRPQSLPASPGRAEPTYSSSWPPTQPLSAASEGSLRYSYPMAGSNTASPGTQRIALNGNQRQLLQQAMNSPSVDRSFAYVDSMGLDPSREELLKHKLFIKRQSDIIRQLRDHLTQSRDVEAIMQSREYLAQFQNSEGQAAKPQARAVRERSSPEQADAFRRARLAQRLRNSRKSSGLNRTFAGRATAPMASSRRLNASAVGSALQICEQTYV